MTSSYHPLNCQLYPVNWPKPKWVGWRLKNDQSLSESEWHSVWAQTTLDPLHIYRWPRFSPSSFLLTCTDLAFVLYIFRPFQPFFIQKTPSECFSKLACRFSQLVSYHEKQGELAIISWDPPMGPWAPLLQLDIRIWLRFRARSIGFTPRSIGLARPQKYQEPYPVR